MTVAATELSIDALLRKRVHGAANIRGIRYQILTAVLVALERLPTAPPGAGIRLEGLEDFDPVGFQAGDEYIQAKFEAQSWAWKRMAGPIESFLQILRAPGADPTARFRLLVSFDLRKEIATLAAREARPLPERDAIDGRFRRLVRGLGGTDQNATDLLSRLTIESLPEAGLWNRLRRAVAEAFDLGTEAVDTYVLVLVSRFLGWAEQRRTIVWAEIQEVRVAVGEALTREEGFQAYGRGLVQRLHWVADAEPSDFFEGKGTRPGHVAADVDVRRPRWLARIAESISAGRVCIVRAPSGQGKSALAYRAAREHGPEAGTFILRIAHTPEDVEHVRHHLRFRVSLNLPMLVMMDVDSRTRRWFDVAEECATLGVPAIVTIREEDWFRYSRESRFDFDVLEPWLDLDEAREIFTAFEAQGRIHPEVLSPEWAYERIGEPRLLLEYVYLLTHGRMLEERLADQVRQFREQGESPGKLEILRRATLAHALGAGVSVRKLLIGVAVRDDPQEVIGSMVGEYIQVRDGQVEGLHWVRSEHLARLLHEVYPNPADTVLALLPAVEDADLPTVVSRAYRWVGLDRDRLIQGLAEYASLPEAPLPLGMIEGLFEAGEELYFSDNREVFDRAYAIGRIGGTFLLASAVLPVHRIEPLPGLEGLLPNVVDLRQLAADLPPGPRGLALCQQFLRAAVPHLTPGKIAADITRAGRLMDWLAVCEFQPPDWVEVYDRLVRDPRVFQLGLDDFCAFSQGLFRLNADQYWRWYRQHEDEILGYLKVTTDCLELTADARLVRAVFLVDFAREQTPAEMRTVRGDRLRSALPFAERYQTQGIWLTPFGLQPSVDDTVLDSPRDRYPLPSDASKNAVWGRIVDRSYFPDTHYSLQGAWHEARANALDYAEWLSKWLQRIIAGKRSQIDEAAFNALLLRTREAIRGLPNPSVRVASEVHSGIPRAAITALGNRGVSRWAFAFNNFFRQVHEFLVNKDQDSKRLLLVNFRDAHSHLKDIHEAFGDLFAHVPDYFGAHKLNARERSAYSELSDVLEAWLVTPPPPAWRKDPITYARAARAQKERAGIARVKAALEAGGYHAVLAREFFREHPLTYLAAYVEVGNPYVFFDDVMAAAAALAPVGEIANFFWLLPTWRGARPLDRGYRFSASSLANLLDGQLEHWETLAPQEVPAEILATLPDVPVRLPFGSDVWYGIHGLSQSMQVLQQWMKVIEAVGAGDDRYTAELRERTSTRLTEVANEVREHSEGVRIALHRDFDGYGDVDAVATVDRYLENLIACLLDGRYQSPAEPEEVAVIQAMVSLFDGLEDHSAPD